MRENEFWETVLDRCKKRLAIWKANYLYFGGRMNLIKATLSNLPIHYLSLFKMLQGRGRKLKGFKINSYGGAIRNQNHLENSYSRKETWRVGFGRVGQKEYSSYGENGGICWNNNLSLFGANSGIFLTVGTPITFLHPQIVAFGRASLNHCLPSDCSLNYSWDVAIE